MGGFGTGMFNPLWMMGGKGIFPPMGAADWFQSMSADTGKSLEASMSMGAYGPGMFPQMWSWPGLAHGDAGFPPDWSLNGDDRKGGKGKRRHFSRSRSRGGRSRERSYDRHDDRGKDTDYLSLPRQIMGRVIGKAGVIINKIREESGARIDAEDRTDDQCEFKISGSAEAVARAKRLISEVAEKASGAGDVARSSIGSACRGTEDIGVGDGPCELMEFPVAVMGGIIGSKGAKIMDVRQRSGARVQVEKLDDRCRVQISGTAEQIERARVLVQKLADEDQNAHPPSSTDSGEVMSDSMEFPVSATGRIIGSRGASIAEVRSQSGARVSVEKGDDNCKVQISGTPSQIRRARHMIQSLAEDGGSGGPGGGGRRGDSEDQMDVPQSLVGRVIGKGGETIQRLQKESGARIDVNTSTGDPCLVRLTGSRDAVSRARFLISEVLDRWSGQGGAGTSHWIPPGLEAMAAWGAGPGYGGHPSTFNWGSPQPPSSDGLQWQAWQLSRGSMPPAKGVYPCSTSWDYAQPAADECDHEYGSERAAQKSKQDIDLDEL